MERFESVVECTRLYITLQWDMDTMHVSSCRCWEQLRKCDVFFNNFYNSNHSYLRCVLRVVFEVILLCIFFSGEHLFSFYE